MWKIYKPVVCTCKILFYISDRSVFDEKSFLDDEVKLMMTSSVTTSFRNRINMSVRFHQCIRV